MFGHDERLLTAARQSGKAHADLIDSDGTVSLPVMNFTGLQK
jgi:hypothetical protein